MIRLLMSAVVMVGSVASPSPQPPGSADSSPHDYQHAWWIVVAVVGLAVIIGLGTFYLQRSHRIDLDPFGPDAGGEKREVEEYQRDERSTPTDRRN